MSLCTAVYAFGFATVVNGETNVYFVFFSTLSIYLGHRYYKLKNNQINNENGRIIWMKANENGVKLLLLFSWVSATILGMKFCWERPQIILPFVLAFLISVFYVVRIRNRNLREIPYLKIVLVSFIYWLIVIEITSFDSIISSIDFPNDVAFVQLVFIFAIALLFDIPDVKNDAPSQKTIPQLLGEKRSIFLSVILIAIVLSYYTAKFSFDWKFIGLLLSTFVFYVGLYRSKYKEFYLSVFGDAMLGMMGVYFLL